LNEKVPSNSTASATPTGNVTTPAITPSGSRPITPSASGGAPPENTGAAGKMQVGLGAGVAAGIVGVLAL
jgi:hypothetical protein